MTSEKPEGKLTALLAELQTNTERADLDQGKKWLGWLGALLIGTIGLRTAVHSLPYPQWWWISRWGPIGLTLGLLLASLHFVRGWKDSLCEMLRIRRCATVKSDENGPVIDEVCERVRVRSAVAVVVVWLSAVLAFSSVVFLMSEGDIVAKRRCEAKEFVGLTYPEDSEDVAPRVLGSVYFASVTLATVGYGEARPGMAGPWGRCIVIVMDFVILFGATLLVKYILDWNELSQLSAAEEGAGTGRSS
jgi:hypothetical protein